MARIVRIAKAMPRYKMVPVLDSNGKQVQTPVMNRRTGEQKMTKHGKPVFQRQTREDKSQPLPPHKCEVCQTDLVVGGPYKRIAIKRQYGGITRYRCVNCPDWQPWEISDALWARIAQLQNQAPSLDDIDNQEDAESARDDFAALIRGLGEEKQESLDNMPEGLQQGDTGQQLQEAVDGLEEWASEVEGVDIPEIELEETCGECEGSGQIGDTEKKCPQCGGEGSLYNDEPTAEQIDDWRGEWMDELQAAFDNSPL